MTPVFLCLALASAVTASASDLQRVADWKGAYVAGETAEGKCFYDVGERMTFRLRLGGIGAVPPGDWKFRWRRTGDDGKVEEGTAPIPLHEPFVYTTSIAKPGFVRLFAEVVGAGPNVRFYGGSQGGAQGLWTMALEPAITDAEVFIPWMCDWRGKAFGGRSGTDWGSAYAPGLDYFDLVNFAKRIRPDACVNIFHAGLGDYICPPAGVASLYHALRCRKRIRWVQNCEHGWSSPAKGKQETVVCDGRSFLKP